MFNNYWFWQTAVFLILFAIIVFASRRKKTDSGPMPKETSNELRGLAILGVLFAHLTYGKFAGTNFLFPIGIWGGVCVDLFFFLSGFGLASSAIFHSKSIKEFYQKRIGKIYVPLWIFLALLLLADGLFLRRFYPLTEIFSAFAGYFPRADLWSNIDSPLWFLSLLLVYYLLFPLIFRSKHPFWSSLGIMVVGAFVYLPGLPLSAQISTYWRLHWLSFPLGVLYASAIVSPKNICPNCQSKFSCWLYKCRSGLATWFTKEEPRPLAKLITELKNRAWIWRWPLLALLILLAAYTAYYSGVGKGLLWEQISALFTAACVLAIFVLKKTKFYFFELVGVYSFEIYLLHWPLIGRYDFLYKFLPPWLGTVLYLPLLIFLAWLFNLFCQLLEEMFLKLKIKKIPS